MFNLMDAAKKREEIYAKSRHRPMRISVDLLSPVVSAFAWISIDSILALAVLHDMAGDDATDMLGGNASDLIDIPLPLERQDTWSPRWYWKASFGIYDAYESMARFHKKWDEDYDDIVDFGPKRQPRVQISSLHFKSMDMPISLLSTKEIVWFADGDAAETQRLLASYVTHVGARAGAGYGRIGEWVVTEVDDDYSCWIDGKPVRSIPVGLGSQDTSMRREYYGFRPPYWAPQNQTLCYMP
jgi:CRISPR type IV-associated protein Csf3